MLYHYTISRDRRWPLCPTVDAFHRTLHTVTRCTAHTLLLFGAADDHLHLVLEGSRSNLGRRVAALQAGLRRSYRSQDASHPGTERAWAREVANRRHLQTLVTYVVQQPEHHGSRLPVANWQASCFLDLMGMRLLPSFDSDRIRSWLPRLSDTELWSVAGLPVLEPLRTDEVGHFGSATLVRAAATVYAAGTDLSVRRPEVRAARKLAVWLLSEAGLSTEKAAACVGCSSRTVQRLRREVIDARAARAALLLLAIAKAQPSRRGTVRVG